VLWFVQVDAAAGVEAVDEVDGGGARARVGVARRKMKTRRQGGKMKMTPVPIYKEMGKRHARESRRPKKSLCGYADASIFRRSIKR
jgi:hypothetical protein